jgi:hypothetical protein
MSGSLCIDSPLRGLAMPKAYSCDLRGSVSPLDRRRVRPAHREGAQRRQMLFRGALLLSPSGDEARVPPMIPAWPKPRAARDALASRSPAAVNAALRRENKLPVNGSFLTDVARPRYQ